MAKRKTKLSEMPEQVRHDGDLVANFVNTANGKRRTIRSYADLLAWGQRSGVLAASDGERLARITGERPADAEALLGRALELLQCLERILTALVARRAVAVADLETFNGFFGEAMARRRVVPAAGSFRQDFGDGGGDDLDRVLWPVALAAEELLCSKHRGRVYRCPAEGCGLFLVDRTPGKPRRWCTACGRRRRSTKHYQTKVKPERRARKAAFQRSLAARSQEAESPSEGRERLPSELLRRQPDKQVT